MGCCRSGCEGRSASGGQTVRQLRALPGAAWPVAGDGDTFRVVSEWVAGKVVGGTRATRGTCYLAVGASSAAL